MKILRRIHYLLNRRRFDDELAADMEFHREMTGDSSFGSSLRYREDSRDAWGWTWIDRLGQDLRYALRMMRKSPGFTLAAVLMLGIGIGANLAVFGFFDLMVMRPLNVREPETLLRFHRRSPDQYAYSVPYPEAAFFRDNTKTLRAMIFVNQTRVSVEGEPKQVNVHFVSPNFFRELGQWLDVSRDSVVLSNGFWKRHFGADPRVVGQTIHLNGKPATIAGISGPEFGGLSMDEPAMWAPIEQQPYFATGSRLLKDYSVESSGVMLWGRLAPGYTPKAAEEELRSLAAELRKEQPTGIWKDEGLPSQPGGYATSVRMGNSRGTGTESRDKLYPLVGAMAALTLLILTVACANLGSLLLARGVARMQEIHIRLSVGAGAGRLVRQLFTESALLALLGSAAGLAFGYWMLRTMMAAAGAPAWLDPTPDWRTIAFAGGIGLVSAMLFGLAPAWQIARQKHKAARARQFLVGAQVAASCMLLIVSALLSRAANRAIAVDPGFDYEHLISIDPALGRHGWKPEQARTYLETLQNRLRGIAGVESVATTNVPPLGRVSMSSGFVVEGRQVATQVYHVDSEYFHTMQIRLLQGRVLARKEAVVSESFARAAWPGQDVIGRKLPLDDGYTVVGVAANATSTNIEDSDSMQVYLPVSAPESPSLFVLVRTSGKPADLIRSVAATTRAIDRDVFAEIDLVKSGLERKQKNAEYTALAVSALGGIAQLLACLGIAGVVAYSVSQKTRDMGIRIALGARSGHLLGGMLMQFVWPVAAGMVIGMGTAAAASGVLRSVLFGVSHLDPLAYIGTATLFLLTALIAAVLPARRILRINPLQALRHD